MEMYKKPVMEIVELEKVDVLTCSWNCKTGIDENSQYTLCDGHPHSQCVKNEKGYCITQ